jgi:hypothetical protein
MLYVDLAKCNLAEDRFLINFGKDRFSEDLGAPDDECNGLCEGLELLDPSGKRPGKSLNDRLQGAAQVGQSMSNADHMACRVQQLQVPGQPKGSETSSDPMSSLSLDQQYRALQ